MALVAHSGGGSLIFGYPPPIEHIPDSGERIGWLDANCAYGDERRHAEKLADWLDRSPRHRVGIVAYENSEIELAGRNPVGRRAVPSAGCRPW